MPPDQVACLPATTGIFHHGLSVRCVLGQGLTTYWTVPYLRQGQVAARNKYGGYWNKTRSTADSGGLSISCMISSRIIFHIHQTQPPLIIPPPAPPVITVSTRDKLVSTQDRDFPGSFPVGMRGIWGWLLSQAYPFPTARIFIYALKVYDHIVT